MQILRKIKYSLTVIVIALLIISTIVLKKNLNSKKHNIESSYEEELVLKNEEEPETKEELLAKEKCYVDIKGAVTNPGVYYVDCNNTVNDIINLSGGLLEKANTKVTNLAKKIFNEMVIIIYTEEEVKNSNIVDTVIEVIDKECNCPNIQNDSCINTEITEEITNNKNQESNNNQMININTASLNDLLELSGIGESKAKAIIDYRENNGNFKSIEELKNVDGIGDKLYEEIKGKIRV